MITTLIGVPHVSLLQALHVANDVMGAPLLHLQLNRYSGEHCKVHKPVLQRSFLPARIAYASSIKALVLNHYRLVESESPIFILVNASHTELDEYGIEIFPKLEWTVNDALHYHSIVDPGDIVLDKTKNTVEAIMASSTKSSLIQQMHALFYRIQDKEERRAAQNGVYQYMAGGKNKPFATGITKLDDLQTSPQAVVLRAHAAYAMKHGIDNTLEAFPIAVDEFELRYLLAKLEILKRPVVERRRHARKEEV